MGREGREAGHHTRELTWGRLIPKMFGLKSRGAKFCEFVKPVGLGARSFKSQLTQHWVSQDGE